MPPRSSLPAPSRSLSRSPARRATAIPSENPAKPVAAAAALGTEVLLQVDPAPIADRALDHHHQEAQDADQHHAAGPAGEPRPSPACADALPSAGRDPERHEPQPDADDHALEAWVEPGGTGDRGETGGGKSADDSSRRAATT